jgi:hypothetical protein
MIFMYMKCATNRQRQPYDANLGFCGPARPLFLILFDISVKAVDPPPPPDGRGSGTLHFHYITLYNTHSWTYFSPGQVYCLTAVEPVVLHKLLYFHKG